MLSSARVPVDVPYGTLDVSLVGMERAMWLSDVEEELANVVMPSAR